MLGATGRVVAQGLAGSLGTGSLALGYDADSHISAITDTTSDLVPVVTPTPVTPTPAPGPGPDPGTPTPSATATPTTSAWGCASLTTPVPGPTATPTAPVPYDSSSVSCFGYDLDGHTVTDTVPGGVQTTRDVDDDGRLRGLDVGRMVPLSDPSSWGRTFSYARSPQGWTTREADGYTSADGVAATERDLGYEAHGYLQSASDTRTGDAFAWAYDGEGNLTQQTSGVSLGRLMRYSYANADGTRPATVLPNEVLEVFNRDGQGSETDYGYDASGNPTTITDKAAGSDARVTGLSYDAAGRVARVDLPNGGHVTVGYNARGLRSRLAVYAATATQPTYSETFAYRGDRVGAVAVDGAHPFAETFVYRPDGTPLELLYREPSEATQRYWYIVDGQGSVVALTDASGQVVNQYAYDPWGAGYNASYPEEATQETVLQPLRYRGYWDDAWYGGDTSGTVQGALARGATLARVRAALHATLGQATLGPVALLTFVHAPAGPATLGELPAALALQTSTDAAPTMARLATRGQHGTTTQASATQAMAGGSPASD